MRLRNRPSDAGDITREAGATKRRRNEGRGWGPFTGGQLTAMGMRKFAGALVAAAVMLPVGLVASPAGAVGGTTCKTATGTATFTPPLPKIGSAKKVKSYATIEYAKVGGCVGGAVTAAILHAQLQFGTASNCSSLLAGKTANVTGRIKIPWYAGKVFKGTSLIAKAKLTPVKGKPTTQVVSGVISSGVFKGSSLKATTLYTIKAPQCASKALSKVTFALVKNTKLVIK